MSIGIPYFKFIEVIFPLRENVKVDTLFIWDLCLYGHKIVDQFWADCIQMAIDKPRTKKNVFNSKFVVFIKHYEYDF